jgi:hypothetical protein
VNTDDVLRLARSIQRLEVIQALPRLEFSRRVRILKELPAVTEHNDVPPPNMALPNFDEALMAERRRVARQNSRTVKLAGPVFLEPMLFFNPAHPSELADKPIVLIVGNRDETWSFRHSLARRLVFTQVAELSEFFSYAKITDALGLPKPLRTVNLEGLERSPNWDQYVSYVQNFRAPLQRKRAEDADTVATEPAIAVVDSEDGGFEKEDEDPSSKKEPSTLEPLVILGEITRILDHSNPQLRETNLRGFLTTMMSTTAPSAQILMEGFYQEPRMVWFQRRTAIQTLLAHGFPPEFIDRIAAIFVQR